jgi:diguanylate cyclase (GGDEF)-like protein
VRPGDKPRSISELLGNLQALSVADRSLFAGFVMMPAILLFAALVNAGSGWPYLERGASSETRKLLGSVSLMLAVPWLGLLVAGLWSRRQAPDSRVLMHVTVHLYSITAALYTCVTGPFDAPGWTLFLGGAIVGYLLFPRVVVNAGVVSFFLVVVGGAFAITRGPWTVLDAEAMGLDTSSILRQGLLSMFYSAFTLWVCGTLIDRWRDREAHLEELTRTDALTGLANRRRFLEVCTHELSRARRYERRLAVVLIDLDHFKKVNDTRGHLAGDRVLIGAAQRLSEAVREIDLASRWGGEEFAILLPDTDSSGAAEVASRYLKRLAGSPIDVSDGPSVTITASAGVAALPDPDLASVEDLLRKADEALYLAKEGGRNRVVVCSSSIPDPVRDEPTRRLGKGASEAPG